MDVKKRVGYKAAEYVEDGMVVGLGTGSTAYYLVEALGKRLKNEGLQITGVATSNRTAEHAESLGIPLKEIDDVERIDLTIDGADEISEDFQGIKGGGGALLFEKIVATYSDRVIWIVDESKMVSALGAFPLPIEVVPFGSGQTYRLFKEKGYRPTLRKDEEGGTYRTDSGNYIIDLQLDSIADPVQMGEWLKQLTGVVEHGLFLDCVDLVIVGTEDGVELKEAR